MSRLDPQATDYVCQLAWTEERRKSWGEYDNIVLLRLKRGVSIEAALASEARRPLWSTRSWLGRSRFDAFS